MHVHVHAKHTHMHMHTHMHKHKQIRMLFLIWQEVEKLSAAEIAEEESAAEAAIRAHARRS